MAVSDKNSRITITMEKDLLQWVKKMMIDLRMTKISDFINFLSLNYLAYKYVPTTEEVYQLICFLEEHKRITSAIRYDISERARRPGIKKFIWTRKNISQWDGVKHFGELFYKKTSEIKKTLKENKKYMSYFNICFKYSEEQLERELIDVAEYFKDLGYINFTNALKKLGDVYHRWSNDEEISDNEWELLENYDHFKSSMESFCYELNIEFEKMLKQYISLKPTDEKIDDENLKNHVDPLKDLQMKKRLSDKLGTLSKLKK